jgi:pimeloyl-ACP methyl ester carboxylesterase
MKRYLQSLVLIAFVVSCTPQKEVPKIVGIWIGDLIVNEDVSLRIGFEVISENDSLSATMASIDQGAYGIEVNSISMIEDSVVFSVNAMGATYTGHFVADTLIEGQFAQGDQPPLVLNFARAESIPGAPPKRHQNPTKPYPYQEEEIEFVSSISEFKLAGTLTYPKRGKNFPAVLLIPGSGPNDRDETIWGHKIFLVLADYLTRNGIAVLRLDDRGVGESTGDFGTASISDFADDAVAGINYLRSREDISIGKIGLIGHSLGADIAPLAANRSSEASFVVLMAGSGITLAETIHFQTEHIYTQRGASASAIDLNKRINQAVFDIAAANLDRPAMEDKLTKTFNKLSLELDQISEDDRHKAELPEVLKPEDYYGFLAENMRYDLVYNPCDQLDKIKIPLLMLAGEMDTQVSAEHNIPLMKAALRRAGNEHFTENIFSNVNHLFQTCSTGEIEEYNQIGETIAPEVLKTISDWIDNTIE